MSLTPVNLARNALLQFNIAAGRQTALPLLIFFPTARCNSRCVSCDWWKSDGAGELTLEEIETLVNELPGLGVQVVLFSGGEPLLRREVYEMAGLFRAHNIRLHLLTSGLFLERDAAQVACAFENVTISLDGHTSALYQKIRGVDGLELLARGVQKFRAVAPGIPVKARSTLHRYNFRNLPDLVEKARELKLDQISFLAADVTSEAFGRENMRTESSTRGLLLNEQEVQEFSAIVEQTIRSHEDDFATHFIAETPSKLRRLPAYYAAQLGDCPFPPVSCNAPWVSAVIEADGAVRPCYFHAPTGNIREKSLEEILKHEMHIFLAGLDVARNPVCRSCVCSLKVGLRSTIW